MFPREPLRRHCRRGGSRFPGHLYRATSGDVDAVEPIGDIGTGQVIGFAGEWVYVSGTLEGEAIRQVHRFKKLGGVHESIKALGSSTAAAFWEGTLLFVELDKTREFVNLQPADGTRPTIVGYLPGKAPLITYLAMDRHFVYATKGFTLARFRR